MTLDLPEALSEQVMNALKADPRTVDLRSLAPHFYRLGVRILQLFEEEEIMEILSDVSKVPSPVSWSLSINTYINQTSLPYFEDIQTTGNANCRPCS